MKQKLEITKKYHPDGALYLYYGYKYIFFNLIRVWVCTSWKFEECERKLVEMLQSYKEVTINTFWR